MIYFNLKNKLLFFIMSGSHALAAARRRRAGPTSTPPSPSPVSIQSNQKLSDVSEVPQKQKINPAQMLLNHNTILENLQEVVTRLDVSVENQKKDIEVSLESLKMDDSSISFFKEKVLSLETQMNEIKKHIIKVQTFAMETNLLCMELKKQNNSSSEEVLEQSETISNILSDNQEIN